MLLDGERPIHVLLKLHYRYTLYLVQEVSEGIFSGLVEISH